jgi:hypothetical protein
MSMKSGLDVMWQVCANCYIKETEFEIQKPLWTLKDFSSVNEIYLFYINL